MVPARLIGAEMEEGGDKALHGIAEQQDDRRVRPVGTVIDALVEVAWPGKHPRRRGDAHNGRVCFEAAGVVEACLGLRRSIC